MKNALRIAVALVVAGASAVLPVAAAQATPVPATGTWERVGATSTWEKAQGTSTWESAGGKATIALPAHLSSNSVVTNHVTCTVTWGCTWYTKTVGPKRYHNGTYHKHWVSYDPIAVQGVAQTPMDGWVYHRN